eukprot:scpid49497/ scgid24169/ Sorting nexin-29
MADALMSERQRLLERLLEAVKQCQVRFGGRSEVATDSDSRVSCLCTQLEAVFQHGLKRNRKLLNLKKPESDPVFWHCIRESISKDEVDAILQLKNVATDAGRGRAWLRVALNERTLETKLHQLLADYKQLGVFYETSAFLFDVERSSMLPIMAAGLGSILFALQQDKADLDSAAKPTAPVSAPKVPQGKTWSTPAAIIPQSAQDDELVTSSSTQQRKKKKKSLNRPAIRSFSVESDSVLRNDTPPSAALAAAAVAAAATSNSQTSPGMSDEASGANSRPDMGADASSPEHLVQNAIAGHAEVVERVRAYLDTADAAQPGDGVASPTPVSPDAAEISWDSLLRRPTPRDLTEEALSSMAAYADSDTSSTSDNTVGSRAADFGLDDSVLAMKAMRSLSLAQTEADSPSTAQTVKAPSDVSSTSQLSNEDMRTALLAMAKRKDELELRNRILEEERASEMARSNELLQQLQELRDLSSTQNEQNRTHTQALTRENELLKHQLKKYVGVVQSLKRETIASLPAETAEAMATLRHDAVGIEPIPPPRKKIKEYERGEEDSQFEQKLVQVAEMHGELLEFNQFMHQQMVNKDKVIAIMRTQLAAAHGVPVNEIRVPGSPQTASPPPEQVAASSGPPSTGSQSLPSNSLIPNCLLNVWIPSVFLYGKGGEGYHVYQVFIRVRDEEWNVYRRYAQFHEFRKHVIQSVPSATRLDFPKKKSFRNKESSFVELRRRGLEKFLRSVLQLLVSGAAKGTSYHMPGDQLSKNLLSHHLPFFREQRAAPTGQQLPHRPVAQRNSPHYNGL